MKVFFVKLLESINLIKNKLTFKKKINYQKEFKKIALISTKPLGIGDLIMSTPFIKTMRENFPNSKLHLITDKDLFDKIDELNKIHIVNGDLISLKKEFSKLSEEKYDLAIIMNRGVNQYYYAKALKPRFFLGYFGGFQILANFKLKNHLKFNKTEHFSYMALNIASSLDLKLEKSLIEPKFSEQTKKSVEKFVKSLNLDKKKTIALNPFVLWESRRWDEKNYIRLIEKLNDKFNLILYGGPDAVELNYKIEKQSKYGVHNITGKLNLKESIYFLKYVDLFITSDCGPMHFAFMMKTPTISFFGPVNPNQRLPLIQGKNKAFWDKPKKMYNYESKYIDDELNGLNKIKVENVYKEINKFFKEGRF
ncbi:MAG: glycosyltransferase family 9 protein [Candidatus Nanoarchaeia archaeon]|nr:glycosyltransferase family 9 protein [Candidatus Nanoarchaeia archaeon]